MYIHHIINDQGEILYCESSSNYTWIYYKNGKKFLVAKTLKFVQMHLSSLDFIRIHAKYLANKNYLKAIDIKQSMIVLENGDMLSISRRKWSQVTTSFKNL